MTPPFDNPESTLSRLDQAGYLADTGLATVAFVAGALERPLLLEGPAGVGKTALAQAVARATGRPLFRLQCYEGLDEARALYEWDHSKQLLYTQLLRDSLRTAMAGKTIAEAANTLAGEEQAFFHERFLLERPLLAAIRAPSPVVLLVDEVDRGDPEFEALLLEVLSEYSISIPELGTFRANAVPFVVLTSNGTRELTDALRRRCVYAYVDYPSRDRELAIVRASVPGIGEKLADEVTRVVARARELPLTKAPSVSETLDWARTLVLLGAADLSTEVFHQTVGVLAKLQRDQARLREEAPSLLSSR